MGALAVEIHLLLNDVSLFSSTEDARRSDTTAPPIAELMARRNTVRVQAPGDLVWEETRTGQVLRRRESLLTLERSKAEIAFLDGTGLVIDENSLVQLEKTPSDDSQGYQKIVVRLLRGKLHKREPRKASPLLARLSEKAPDLEIQVGDTRAVIRPETELTVTALPERMNLEVHQGEIELKTPGGRLTVKQGEEAVLPKDASAVTRKIAFSLQQPGGGENIQASAEQTPVRFRWKNELVGAAGTPLELEASTDPDFKTGVTRLRIPAAEPPLPEIQATLSLHSGPPGGVGPSAVAQATRWHWRVRALDKGATTSSVESFWIVPQPIPSLKLPVDAASFALESAVDLLWTPIEGVAGYAVELTDPQGASRELRVTEPMARVEALEPGQYRWRVRALPRDQREAPWSAARAFTLAEKAPVPAAEELPPPPLELLDPEIEPEINAEPRPAHSWLERLFISSVWASDEKPVNWSVKLKWRAVPKVKKYKLQIGRERSFTNIISETVTSSPEYVWSYTPGTENSKGRVFFRVASMNESGAVGRFSEPKPVQLRDAVAAKTSAPKPVASVAKAPKPPSAPRKNERYDAIDESSREATATDAAESGDLHTLAQESSASKSPVTVAALAKPAPVPTATSSPSPVPAAVREMVDLGNAATAQPPAPMPMPQEPENARTALNASAAFFTGLGKDGQSSSDPSLNSVTIESLYAQQKLGVSSEITRLRGEKPESRWSAELNWSFAKFAAAPAPRPLDQPEVEAWSVRLDVLRHAAPEPRSWSFAYGATLDRSYRWMKSGAQAVTPVGAVSLGPTAWITHQVSAASGGITDYELGLKLAAPLSGALTRGFIGLNGLAWAEWKAWGFSETGWLGLRLEAQGSLQRWSKPEGTTYSSWIVWLAPTIHIGGSGK